MRKIWTIVALHAGAATVFVFLFQRYLLNASLDSSLRWSIAMGLLAAVIAYKQNAR